MSNFWRELTGQAATERADDAAQQARWDATARQQQVDAALQRLRQGYGIAPDGPGRLTDQEEQTYAAQLQANDAWGRRFGYTDAWQAQAIPFAQGVQARQAQDKAALAAENAAQAWKNEGDAFQATFQSEAQRASDAGFAAGATGIRQRMASQGLLGGSTDAALNRQLLGSYVRERQQAVSQAREARRQLGEARDASRFDLERQIVGGNLLNPQWNDVAAQQRAAIDTARAGLVPQHFGQALATVGNAYEQYQEGRDWTRSRETKSDGAGTGSIGNITTAAGSKRGGK